MHLTFPSIHPAIRGGDLSKHLGRHISCKDKKSCDFIVFLDGNSIDRISIISGRSRDNVGWAEEE